MSEYATVKSLPAPIIDTLKALGYGRADVEIRTATTVVMSDSGSTGRRAFAALVNLETGARRVVTGSWGGPNMFDHGANPVDNDNRPYPIPPNGAVITGSEGPSVSGGVIAHVHIPASMRARMLPAPPATLTREEMDALYCHKVIRGGHYRRDELSRRGVSASTVDAMVTRGYLKRNAAGATTITTDGKNAVGDYRG